MSAKSRLQTPQPNSNSGGISGNRERRPSQHSSVASVASDTGRGSFRSRREMMGTQLPITQRLTMRFKNTAVELSLAYTRSRCEMLLFTLVQTPLRCLRRSHRGLGEERGRVCVHFF